MLKSLSIKNFALFENQEIEFNKGLNIILGETGAGKSLIFDALFFVLSFKTDRSLLRTGAEQMRVDAEFYPISKNVHQVLAEMDADDENLIISRIMYVDGRTSIKVNGALCPQSMLKKISGQLIDSLMQNENVDLLKNKNHLLYLDRFCNFGNLKNQLGMLISEKKEIEKKIEELGGDEAERERKKDLLNYQIEEIEKANLKIGEDDELDSRIKLLSSYENIYENLNEVIALLDAGSSNALHSINISEKIMSKMTDIPQVSNFADRLNSIQIDLDDIVSDIKGFVNSVNCDSNELERLDERKDKIKFLKRKYGGTIEIVLSNLNEYKIELNDLDNSENILADYKEKLQMVLNDINKICLEMHKQRLEGAKKIKHALEEELTDLGMKNANFEIAFKEKDYSQDGYDDVCFMFSANKGQELKELSKTASGGESSRILLAMKNIFANNSDEKTLLFDEIDSGISGEVGNKMAMKLSSIATRDQVIAITHLPQVAATGDYFIKVEKIIKNENTYSCASIIKNDESVIEEIAHIIGGHNITDAMLKNSKELFERGRRKLV